MEARTTLIMVKLIIPDKNTQIVKTPIWIRSYYQKISDDKNFDLERRDKFTNWALISLLGILAIIFQYINSELFNPILCLGIIFISISIVFRFFAHSCICYASIQNYKYIITMIEQAFINRKLNIIEFNWVVENYGRRKGCVTKKPLFKAVTRQLKAGFGIIFLICLIFFVIEFIISIVFLCDLASQYLFEPFWNFLLLLIGITLIFAIYICLEIRWLKVYSIFKHISYSENSTSIPNIRSEAQSSGSDQKNL